MSRCQGGRVWGWAVEGWGAACGGLAPSRSSRISHPSVGVRQVAMGPGTAGQVVRGNESCQKIMETGNSYSVIDSFAGTRSMLEHWSLPHWRKGKKRGKESRTQYGENPGEGMVYGPLDGSADTSQPGPQRASSLENISSVMARTLVVFSSDDFPALAWYLAHSTCSVNNLLQGEWVKEECN